MPRSDRAVVLFTLSPETEGERKFPGLGNSRRATELFHALIEHTASACRDLPDVDLLVSSPEKLIGDHLPQRGESFGESLRLAVEDAFDLGYRRVVVVGNDAPEMSSRYLAEAFEELERDESRAVLGPAKDGGYNLIGLTSPCREAFAGIHWSSHVVLAQTRRKLQTEGRQVSLLPALCDIDSPAALARFLRRPAVSPTTGKLLRRLKRVLESATWDFQLPEPLPHARDLPPSRRLRAPPPAL